MSIAWLMEKSSYESNLDNTQTGFMPEDVKHIMGQNKRCKENNFVLFTAYTGEGQMNNSLIKGYACGKRRRMVQDKVERFRTRKTNWKSTGRRREKKEKEKWSILNKRDVPYDNKSNTETETQIYPNDGCKETIFQKKGRGCWIGKVMPSWLLSDPKRWSTDIWKSCV